MIFCSFVFAGPHITINISVISGYLLTMLVVDLCSLI